MARHRKTDAKRETISTYSRECLRYVSTEAASLSRFLKYALAIPTIPWKPRRIILLRVFPYPYFDECIRLGNKTLCLAASSFGEQKKKRDREREKRQRNNALQILDKNPLTSPRRWVVEATSCNGTEIKLQRGGRGGGKKARARGRREERNRLDSMFLEIHRRVSRPLALAMRRV